MTDEELVKALRDPDEMTCADGMEAADRIETLTEQLEAARADAKEAEAYAEELERDLKTCRMAQAVMENTVAELELKSEWFEEEWVSAVDKLNKAVEALRGLMQHMPDYADTVWQDARATLAEIEGEKT
jgi:chromosome segregation ATPase